VISMIILRPRRVRRQRPTLVSEMITQPTNRSSPG
jgi:hypothetical protein